MIVWIDSDYKCHAANDGTFSELDSPFFDGKCPEFIEGYRYVPDSETWIREDGAEFQGEMIAPWKDYTELYIAQLEYELADADAALTELGVEING